MTNHDMVYPKVVIETVVKTIHIKDAIARNLAISTKIVKYK